MCFCLLGSLHSLSDSWIHTSVYNHNIAELLMFYFSCNPQIMIHYLCSLYFFYLPHCCLSVIQYCSFSLPGLYVIWIHSRSFFFQIEVLDQLVTVAREADMITNVGPTRYGHISCWTSVFVLVSKSLDRLIFISVCVLYQIINISLCWLQVCWGSLVWSLVQQLFQVWIDKCKLKRLSLLHSVDSGRLNPS